MKSPDPSVILTLAPRSFTLFTPGIPSTPGGVVELLHCRAHSTVRFRDRGDPDAAHSVLFSTSEWGGLPGESDSARIVREGGFIGETF